MTRRAIRVLITGLAFLAFAGGAGAATVSSPVAVFISPAEGSGVREGKVTIIGRLPRDADRVEVRLNGKPLGGITWTGHYFSAVVSPPRGVNKVEARSGKTVVGSLSFSYGPGSGDLPVYRYHAPVVEGECQSCHPGEGHKKPQMEAQVCYECHESYSTRPYLHGPVGAGQCFFCHDPHGSVHDSLVRYGPDFACRICHDQKASEGHIRNSKNRDCQSCHDPHGGRDQNFLKK